MADMTEQEAERNEQEQQEQQAEASHETETDWKAQSRKWERIAKQNKAKADRLDEIEAASKTELQKATELAASLQKQLDAYKERDERAEWADEVAKEEGIDARLLEHCRTREEMEGHAKLVKSLMGKRSAPRVGSDGFAAGGERKRSTEDLFAESIENLL